MAQRPMRPAQRDNNIDDRSSPPDTVERRVGTGARMGGRQRTKAESAYGTLHSRPGSYAPPSSINTAENRQYTPCTTLLRPTLVARLARRRIHRGGVGGGELYRLQLDLARLRAGSTRRHAGHSPAGEPCA